MTKKLAGKVALVTGGSRGIGAAIAKRLAEDGATVAISYAASADKANAVVKEIEGMGAKAAAFKADQGDAGESAALIGQVAKKFGRLDILVNSAGVYVTGDAAADPAAVARQFAVNVTGVAAAVRAARDVIAEDGRIVTIGSVVADRIPFPGAADYGATKAAVAGYTRGWARDFAARRVTVNVVQPGPIDTDMNPADSEFAPMLNAMVALGRYGKPEEVAAAVAFLVSPDASYITGTALTVDGGFNA